MDDGSGKCLLDVISDPSALSEFLKSNSQILVDGEDLSNTKAQSLQKFSVSGQKHKTYSVCDTSGVQSSFSGPTGLVETVETSHLEQSTTNDKLSTTTSINSGAQNPFKNNTKTPVMSNVSRTFSHIAKPTGNLAPANVPAVTMASGSKGISSIGGAFQSKKPIPIQPKNQVIRTNTLLPTGINMQSNVHHGLVTQTTPVKANQLQMTPPKVLPKTHVPVSVNGADKSRISQYQTLQPNRTVQGGTQPISTTPPKRIAPKQVLSPPMNPSLTITSPMRLPQTNIINKQKLQLPAHLVQSPVTQVTTQNQSQVYSQQITNAIKQMTPSSQASTAHSVQHVQQIQQLVHEKFGAPQTQPQTNQIQQKVFTQAQLQAALKQSQLLAQNSPGQQNLIVQQQILKQLIQQAQLAQQQKQSDKVQVNVQPSIVQVQQQQIMQTASPSVPNSNASQQLTVPNSVSGNNQKIQMVLPNQQVVAIAQNALSSSQQVLNVGKSATNLSQQNAKQTLNVNNKQQIQVGRQANTTVAQPMMIMSQGNFVVQQSEQPRSTNATTMAGNSVNVQTIQNLISQQQQQQQQVKVVSNVQQVNQGKQANQNSTVYVQNVVGGQSQTLKIQQGGNQQPASTQQNVILQCKQSSASNQGTNTTIQQLTSAQVQQLQNLGAVQKVFIIKQPEVLQKLGVQGAKQSQTIQITPQQLQALQQLQSQQNQTEQKIIIQNSSPGGNKTSTIVLSAQQVKQLHSLQQQAGSGKQGQSPQTLIQRQTLAQQLQKQLSSNQTTKTQPKTAHVPRILQTTGRQPVTTSQLPSKTVITIKQEPNRGIKRSHPETPEPPKVVTRLKSSLYQDQQSVSHPDIHTPFKSKIDAVNKLRCYHVYNEPDKTQQDVEKAEALFNNVAGQLIKRSEKMIEKYRNLMLEESMRKEPSSEMVMLYRLFLADERAALAKDKKQITEDLKALKPLVKGEVWSGAAPPNLTQTTNKTIEIPQLNLESQGKNIESPTLPVQSKAKSTEYGLDVLNTSIAMDSLDDTLQDDVEEEHSNIEGETSEIDKAVFNMETSSSVYYEPVNHLSNSLSPRTSVESKETEDCIAALPMDDDDDEDEDDDTEKEDVTATLALLHSMAEELADIS